MPVVSVIIPTYNHAMYIERTLESVFQQTYKNYEIIVIDDGSTDNTQEVIKSYENKITYICKENEGTAKSRNLGLKIAKGKYVAFLDSDDLWMPQKLELQVTLLDKNIDIGLVCTDFEIFCENEEGIKIIEKRINLRRIGSRIIKQSSPACSGGNTTSISYRGNHNSFSII